MQCKGPKTIRAVTPSSNVGTVFEITGAGFATGPTFAGTPGTPNCFDNSVSALAQQFGGLNTAAYKLGLGFGNVSALQDAIHAYCGG